MDDSHQIADRLQADVDVEIEMARHWLDLHAGAIKRSAQLLVELARVRGAQAGVEDGPGDR